MGPFGKTLAVDLAIGFFGTAIILSIVVSVCLGVAWLVSNL